MARRTFGTVGYVSGPTPAERKWKVVAEWAHLERRVTTYGVETRCRECKVKARGYSVSHFSGCSHRAIAMPPADQDQP